MSDRCLTEKQCQLAAGTACDILIVIRQSDATEGGVTADTEMPTARLWIINHTLLVVTIEVRPTGVLAGRWLCALAHI